MFNFASGFAWKANFSGVKSPGVHSTQKVRAPFEQRVLNRTLNVGILNPKRVVTFTPVLPFHMPISLEWDDLRIWGAQKEEIFPKNANSGEFLGTYRKRTLNAGTRGFLDLNIYPFSHVFLFGRLTHSYIISAPPGLSPSSGVPFSSGGSSVHASEIL